MNGTILIKNRHGRALHQSIPTTGRQYPATFRRGWRTVARALNAVVKGIAEARRIARAYDELAAMSDPELCDIGINRSDIPAVVSGTYRRALPPISNPASSSRRERSPSPNRCDKLCDQGASP